MRKFILILLVLGAVFLMACGDDSGTDKENENNTNDNTGNTTNNAKNAELSFGDTFIFDELEITFNSDIEFTIYEYEKQEVIKIPMTIKNLKNETHGLNFIYHEAYQPDGTKADTAESFFDDSFFSAGKMRSEASINTFFYIYYYGDGDYYVEFDDFSTKVEIKLPIKK